MVTPLDVFDPERKFKERYDIIKQIFEYAHTYGEINLRLCGEGVCLIDSGLDDIVRLVATTLNIPNDKISIIGNGNLLKNDVPYNTVNRYIVKSQAICKRIDVEPKKISSRFGCFVGRSNWNRLAMSVWLKKYAPGSIQSFHSDLYESKTISRSIRDLYEAGVGISQFDVGAFLERAPLKLGDITGSLGDVQVNEILDMAPYYKKIFLEVVMETTCSGNIFFPTEKIFRPIAFKTPFIVYGPKDFLKNLKRMGFKTFDEFFSESYDEIDDNHVRFNAVIQQLRNLNDLSPVQLNDMYKGMMSILDYNYNVLQELKTPEILREFSIDV